MAKILIADDQAKYVTLIEHVLKSKGFDVLTALDGQEAYEVYSNNNDISLLILDVMMPKLNGYELCRKIRLSSNVPIIFLTALGEDENELDGLLSGANDYIRKPFNNKILLARVMNLLNNETKNVITIDNIIIDKDKMQVYTKSELIDLAPKEYSLLMYLMNNSNIILTRDQILDNIWGIDFKNDIRTVDTHVKILRSKLSTFGERIKTKRGIGYMLEVSKNEIN